MEGTGYVPGIKNAAGWGTWPQRTVIHTALPTAGTETMPLMSIMSVPIPGWVLV